MGGCVEVVQQWTTATRAVIHFFKQNQIKLMTVFNDAAAWRGGGREKKRQEEGGGGADGDRGREDARYADML
jgi:hypothetical protein